MNELKKSFSFGGGTTHRLTCKNAATHFVENVLSKNLESENVWFPEHEIKLGINPEGPNLSEQKLNDFADNNPNDKGDIKTWFSNLRGAECERIFLMEYLKRTPASVRFSLFHGFKKEMFLSFTTNARTRNLNKEYDFILILPEYKLIIFFEVKASPKMNNKWQKEMKKAETFFKELLVYVGEDINTTEWSFLPVGVYPNVSQSSQKVCVIEFISIFNFQRLFYNLFIIRF